MAASCHFQRPGYSGRATWRLDPDALSLAPVGVPPEAYAINELRGVGGDQYAIELHTDQGTLVLSKLGADGANLLAAIERSWAPARALVLRLAASAAAETFRGAISTSSASSPLTSLLALYDDLLVAAPHGQDIAPIFLAHLAEVAHDEPAYRVDLRNWDGTSASLTRLAGQTTELARALADRRTALAGEASAALARQLPTLGPAARASLSSHWLPGRLLHANEIERIATGARGAIEGSWVPTTPRRGYYRALADWASDGDLWLGYSRAGVTVPADEVEDQSSAHSADEASATDAPAEDTAPSALDPDAPMLWLLARRGSSWALENLSTANYATYRFTADTELVGLVSCLLAAPQFSREALYLPLERLAGARHQLAIAARDLGFLVALRSRFAGRIIHTNPAAWKKGLAAAS